MNPARSSALHQRNRLLLRTAAQSRRALTTSIPVASPSSSLPSSGHGHGHGKAFNSSLAVESIARSDPAEFATINQFETSQMFPEPISPIKQHEKLVQSGVLRSDDHQIRIVGKLQRFWEQVLKYNPPPIPDARTSDSLVIFFHFLSGPLTHLLLDISFVFSRTSSTRNGACIGTKRSLPLWRRWHRKDNAYGPLLPNTAPFYHTQASCALPRFHDRCT